MRAIEIERTARPRLRLMRSGLCALALLCAACSPQGPDYTVQRLKSGQSIKVVSVTVMHFSNDSPSLILTYETDLPLSDKARLNAEVDEIWKEFEPQANSANVLNAAIIAKEASGGGFIRTSQQFGYAFHRNSATEAWTEQNRPELARDNRGATGLDSVSAHRL